MQKLTLNFRLQFLNLTEAVVNMVILLTNQIHLQTSQCATVVLLSNEHDCAML